MKHYEYKCNLKPKVREKVFGRRPCITIKKAYKNIHIILNLFLRSISLKTPFS